MKKQYKLSIKYDDSLEEVDNLHETLEEVDDYESVWLDTGDGSVELPKEIAKYLELNGILGIT
jgi:uncharacterized protein